MNKKEAIAEMKKGIKIKHKYFTTGEWMIIEGSKIMFEDGAKLTQAEFWKYRKSKEWDNDYSFYVA